MAILDKAVRIAAQAHEGQKDRYGLPYIMHPIRVMMNVDAEAERIVAILHDVVEDSDWTLEDLRKEGFGPEIITAVDCITKRDGEDYDDYIERVETDELARTVKLADLEDNMDLKRIKSFNSEKDPDRLAKYHKVWLKLKALGEQ